MNTPVCPTFRSPTSKGRNNHGDLTVENPILIHDGQIDMQVHIVAVTMKEG